MTRAWVVLLRKAVRRAGALSLALFSLAVLVGDLSPAYGQEGRYYPLDQYAPVGQAGRWSAQIGRRLAGTLQPVQIALPSTGEVTVYNGGPASGVTLSAPAHFSVEVGSVYRLKITRLPEFPADALYPTIEILDRLHAPPGLEHEFPVTIAFTSDEIQSVLRGRMVTKVVYLEQPQLAVTGDVAPALLNRMLPPDRNLLIEADRVGRPMVLVRLGGRVPDASRADFAFYPAPALISFERPPVRPRSADSGRTVVRDRATVFTPADPRSRIDEERSVRLAGRRGLSRPTPLGARAALEPALPPWELYPDEYLLDGGDRDLPVHVTAEMREGLDSEDAVAEYADSTGRRHILPTNRVAIYSPRFGSLGTATGLEAGVTVFHAASALKSTRGEGLRDRVVTADHEQRMPSQSVRVRSRASGFAAEEQEAGFHQRTVLNENRELAGSVEGVQNEVAPVVRQADAAVTGKKRQAAVAWSRADYPIVTASLTGAQEVTVKFVPNEIVGVEDRRTKGRMEIVKLADKQTALPGEIVNFTIEYQNIGDLELRDVQLIDNLTPRLEYVAESANSDRPAAFNVSNNGEGSVILAWSLKGPLPGKAKGTVTFKARVR